MNFSDEDTAVKPESGAQTWRSATLFILTAAGVLACFLFVNTLLLAVTGAITLAIITAGPHRWLLRRFGPTASASLMLLAVSLALLVPGFFLVRGVLQEVMGLVHLVQSGAASEAFFRMAAKHEKTGGLLQRALDDLAPGDTGQQIAGFVATWLGRAVGGFVRGLTQVVLMLFFLFFLLRDRDASTTSFKALVPLENDETEMVMKRLSDLVNAIFAGRLVIAGIQGLLAGLSYWALGVPGSLLWGTVTAVFCLIPAFGAFIAWVPIALYLGLSGSWTKAAILAVWGSVVLSTLDNFLYPVLVGKHTDLHTAVIFVAIFGGVALFGVSGFVIGPVLVAVTMLLLEVWQRRLRGRSAD